MYISSYSYVNLCCTYTYTHKCIHSHIQFRICLICTHTCLDMYLRTCIPLCTYMSIYIYITVYLVGACSMENYILSYTDEVVNGDTEAVLKFLCTCKYIPVCKYMCMYIYICILYGYTCMYLLFAWILILMSILMFHWYFDLLLCSFSVSLSLSLCLSLSLSLSVSLSLSRYACMHKINIYICICIYVCTCMSLYLCIYVYVYIYIYMGFCLVIHVIFRARPLFGVQLT